MFEGQKIKIGDRELEIPPLSFGNLMDLEDKIAAIMDGDAKKVFSKERIQAQLDVIHAAVKRNYPDITADWLRDNLDLGNAIKVIKMVLSTSGVGEKSAGAPQPEGGGTANP